MGRLPQSTKLRGWASPSPWELGPREPSLHVHAELPQSMAKCGQSSRTQGIYRASHSSAPPVHRTIVQGAPSCVLGSLSPGCSTTPPVHERLSSHSFRSLGGAVHCQACTSSPPVQMAIVLACQDPGVHTASPTPTPPVQHLRSWQSGPPCTGSLSTGCPLVLSPVHQESQPGCTLPQVPCPPLHTSSSSSLSTRKS